MNCKCWNLKTLGTPVAVQSCGGRQMKTSHFTQGRQKREIVALPVFCTLSHFNQLPSSQFHTDALSDGELQNLFGKKKLYELSWNIMLISIYVEYAFSQKLHVWVSVHWTCEVWCLLSVFLLSLMRHMLFRIPLWTYVPAFSPGDMSIQILLCFLF